MSKIPYHVAIIMDGNGRWAQKRGLPRIAGHKAGVDALKRTVSAASEIGIKVLTVYAFSTENWKRPREEVQGLMELLAEHLEKNIQELHSNNIRINCIGLINELDNKTKKSIEKAEQTTCKNDGLVLNVALNYGGRNEIVRAAQKLSYLVKQGVIEPEDIDEDLFTKYTYTAEYQDPDLLIRPSGEMRISNFLLWQIAYTEIYFTKVYWPDFSRENLEEAIIEFGKRHRRFGGI